MRLPQPPPSGTLAALKVRNTRSVLESIAREGAQSRVELAKRLNLSQASVSRISDSLLQAGILSEGGQVASKVGPRQTLLEINPAAARVAGVSIRPKRLRLRLADLQGNLLYETATPLEAQGMESLLDQLSALIERTLAEVASSQKEITALAVGVTGAWDEASRRVHAAPNLAFLEGSDLHKQLSGHFALPRMSVCVDNDVNFAALGEWSRGAAQVSENFFYLSLGSGIGGGLVVGGKLVQGTHGFAGELGYLPVPSPTGYQPLEALVSRAALARRASLLGLDARAEALFEAARDGHTEAQSELKVVAETLALALSSVITVASPERIILGGSLGRHSVLLIPRIEAFLAAHVPFQPPLVETALGGNAALIGAVSQAVVRARHALVSLEL